MDVNNEFYLERFLDAQQDSYPAAMRELRFGKKHSHWIWYIFPQLKGLGRSATSNIYGIQDAEEARAYFEHLILGARLREAITAMLFHRARKAEDILGEIDAMKFKSCLTLFSLVAPHESIFADALDVFFNGERDERTVGLLNDFEDES